MAFHRILTMIMAATALSEGAIGQQTARAADPGSAVAHSDQWPKLPLKRQRDPKVEAQQSRVDRAAQGDSLRFASAGNGPARAAIEEAKPIDIAREPNGQLSLLLDYRVTGAPTGEVTLGMEGGKAASVPITGALKAEAGQWRQLAVPLRCFADGGVAMGAVTKPWTIAAGGRLTLDISAIRIASAPPGPVSCGVR